MRKSKGIILAALSCLSVGSMCALAYGNSGDSIFGFMSSAQEVRNVAMINKASVRDTTRSKVTATTEKGNSVQFSYSRFDTRNGTTDYNNGVCFYKTLDNLGGYIKNDTALYSVSSIKIYGYSTADPEPSTLTNFKFNIYYGYESILVDRNNTAKVTITDGQYTFKEGYEPSYIAIECIENFDAFVSKIEISYKCSPVSGTITDLGPAYKYDAEGKLFTSSTGKKVAYNITKQAPWVHLDGLDDEKRMAVRYNGTYNGETHEYVTTGPSYIDLKFNNGQKIDVTDTRKIISATVTLTIPEGTDWGSNTDLYMGVNGNVDGYIYNRMSGAKILGGANAWESSDKIVSVVDENGNNMAGQNIFGKKITIDFDASSCTKDIVNVAFGTSNAKVHLVIHDVSVKATACGHEGYVSHSSGHAYRYEAAGVYSVCPDCGESLKTREQITTPAPWLRLAPQSTPGITFHEDGSLDSLGGWDSKFVYQLPADLEGRTDLAITFAAPKDSYDYYFQIGNQSGNQIVTASTKINWGENAMVTAVYGALEQSLNYNASTYSIGEKAGTNKVTIIYDLTKASSTMTGATLSLTLYTVGTYGCFSADLRTPCDHSNQEYFSSSCNCGMRCSDCGMVSNSYVSKIDTYIPAAHVDEGIMTYQYGATFQDKECFKITTTAFTNNADMGYTVNYKVYFRNLIANAKKAGKSTIKITFYNEATINYNIRLYWGVGNNVSAALADHYNNPTKATGSDLMKDHSTITDLSGNAATAYANQWRVLVIDISDSAFAATNVSDFFICGLLDCNGAPYHYPLTTYISDITCVA